MMKEDENVADRPYLERQIIVVSKQAIVKATEEEIQKESRSSTFTWTTIAAAVKPLLLRDPVVLAVSVGADVAIKAFESWIKARDNGVPVLQISVEQAKKLKFPPGHPRFGVVYIGHPSPSRAEVYFPLADFHRRMLEEKWSEAVLLLMGLGATSIRAEHISGSSRDMSSTVKASSPAKGIAVDGEASVSSRAGKSFRFDGGLSGAIPPKLVENLIWYDHEATWKMVAEGRLFFGMARFAMEISYSDDFGVNGKLKAGLDKTGLEFGGTFDGHESSIWKLEGEFGQSNSN